MLTALSRTTLAVGGNGMPVSLFWIILGLACAAIAYFAFTIVLVYRYKRCPPNRLLVISGRTASGQSCQIVHGGAVFVYPLLQDYGWLSLDPMRVNVSPPSDEVQSTLGFQVPLTYIVAIGTAPELAQNAATRLLGLPQSEIEEQARDMIAGELSSVIDRTLASSGPSDRGAFHECLQSALESRIRLLGLELISMKREQ